MCFAEAFKGDELKELADTVKAGAGLIMLGGFHSFGPGGYSETPLADVLPVATSRPASSTATRSKVRATKRISWLMPTTARPSVTSSWMMPPTSERPSRRTGTQ